LRKAVTELFEGSALVGIVRGWSGNRVMAIKSDLNSCSAAGYFSSRAAAKGYIRGATSYLQAARQLEVACRLVCSHEKHILACHVIVVLFNLYHRNSPEMY
jgi:hypothetical protein